jgi:hypothetical protein
MRRPSGSFNHPHGDPVSAVIPLISGKIPLFGRKNSAAPSSSGIGSQALELTLF